MSRSKHRFSEHRLEQLLGNLLRSGVALSAILVTVGGVLYLIRHGAEPPKYHTFRPAVFLGLPNIVEGAVTLQQSRSLIQLGLLVLIATPILRVVFSVYGFWRQGDRTYVLITLIVLRLLLYSLFQV